MRGFLLDTSVINRICDGSVSPQRWASIYITDVTLLELYATRKEPRRRALVETLLQRISPHAIVRASSEPLWSGEDGTLGHRSRPLGRYLPLIARAIGTDFHKHHKDAFIVDAARQRGLTLVTADRDQARAARGSGVTVEEIPRTRVVRRVFPQ